MAILIDLNVYSHNGVSGLGFLCQSVDSYKQEGVDNQQPQYRD